jgi:hypothetical protein
MDKQTWVKHIKETTSYLPPSEGGDSEPWQEALRYHNFLNPDCLICKSRSKTRKTARNKRERESVYRDCGLVKAIGCVSGKTYWE